MEDDTGQDGNFRDVLAIAEQLDQRSGKAHNGRRVCSRKCDTHGKHELCGLQYARQIACAPTETQNSFRAHTKAGDRQCADGQQSHSYPYRRDAIVPNGAAAPYKSIDAMADKMPVMVAGAPIDAIFLMRLVRNEM